MSKIPLFKDLKKRPNDLLTKDFPGDKQEKKVEWKGDTPNGVGFETSFVQDDKNNITATIKPKFKYPQYRAEVNGEFNTKQDVKIELSVDNQFVDNSKEIFSINNKKGDFFGAFGFEFKNKNAVFNSTVDYGKKQGPTVQTGLVLGTDELHLGLSANYLFSKSALETFEVVGAYRTAESDATLFGRIKPDERSKKDAQEVGFSYYHEVNEDLAFGAEGQYNLTTKVSEVAAGLQVKVNKDTILKGKLNNEGRLGVSYQQKFNKLTRLSLSSTFDLQGVRSGSTFGFGVHFTA